jgi:hypothetical protein
MLLRPAEPTGAGTGQGTQGLMVMQVRPYLLANAARTQRVARRCGAQQGWVVFLREFGELMNKPLSVSLALKL